MTRQIVLLSGAFSSFGGLFGKLSGLTFVENNLINYGLQMICFILMISFNSASLPLYVKALQESGSFKATVISSSVNFFLSGIFGVLVFNEVTGFLWWCGITAVLAGLMLIQTSHEKTKEM